MDAFLIAYDRVEVLKGTHYPFEKWPLDLSWISNKTIMEAGDITKAFTSESFLYLIDKYTQLLFFLPVLFYIFMSQTLIDGFWGLHKNMNCAFPLNAVFIFNFFRS